MTRSGFRWWMVLAALGAAGCGSTVVIPTADGGLYVTNRDDLAQQMALLRSHGITRDAALLEKKDEGGWYYEQQCLGPGTQRNEGEEE